MKPGGMLMIALWLLAPASNAQPAGDERPLFASQVPLTLTISGPLRRIARDEAERAEHEAQIEWLEADGRAIALDIEIRLRGKSRVANCDYPPLSLDFPRSRVDGTVFAGQNRLKLVTLCRRSDRYRDYLGQEFLIYRMLNELTERSLRVRWATVEYLDTERRRPRPYVDPAFLLESDDEAGGRLGLSLAEIDSIAVDDLDARYAALLAVFQYLIGNTDWAIIDGPPGELCCHNGEAMIDGAGRYVVVPYDFDNAGLISAEYAVPADTLPIRSVRQRLFRGFCRMRPEIDAAAAEVRAARDRLLAVFDDAVVSERGRERALDYLADSFAILDDPDEWSGQIDDRCR